MKMEHVAERLQQQMSNDGVCQFKNGRNFVVLNFNQFRPDGDSVPLYLFQDNSGLYLSDIGNSVVFLEHEVDTNLKIGRRMLLIQNAIASIGAELRDDEIIYRSDNLEEIALKLKPFNDLLHTIKNAFE